MDCLYEIRKRFVYKNVSLKLPKNKNAKFQFLLGIDAKPRNNIRKIRMNKYRYYFIFIEVGFLLVIFFKINRASVLT